MYFQKNTRRDPDPKIWSDQNVHFDGLGGAMLDTASLDSSMHNGFLMKGCPIYVNFSDKIAYIVKAATVIDGGTTTAIRVDKNHLFIAGEFVYVSGDAIAIDSIDTSNDDYDIINTSTAVTGSDTAGNILIDAAAAGESPSAKYTANALLGDTVEIISGVTVHPIIKIDQWVPVARIPHTISDLTITALNPDIILKQ